MVKALTPTLVWFTFLELGCQQHFALSSMLVLLCCEFRLLPFS